VHDVAGIQERGCSASGLGTWWGSSETVSGNSLSLELIAQLEHWDNQCKRREGILALP